MEATDRRARACVDMARLALLDSSEPRSVGATSPVSCLRTDEFETGSSHASKERPVSRVIDRCAILNVCRGGLHDPAQDGTLWKSHNRLRMDMPRVCK